MIKFSRLDNKEKEELSNAKYVNTLLTFKIINLCEGQTWLCGKYVKKTWSPQITLLSWIAQRELNSENKNHKKFIDTLSALKIGCECRKKELSIISDFVIASCLCASIGDRSTDTTCQTKFIESVCLEILKCSKIQNKIKFDAIVLIVLPDN
jgi:hypothetical protein